MIIISDYFFKYPVTIVMTKQTTVPQANIRCIFI